MTLDIPKTLLSFSENGKAELLHAFCIIILGTLALVMEMTYYCLSLLNYCPLIWVFCMKI